jgi:hypothetical protein
VCVRVCVCVCVCVCVRVNTEATLCAHLPSRNLSNKSFNSLKTFDDFDALA